MNVGVSQFNGLFRGRSCLRLPVKLLRFAVAVILCRSDRTGRNATGHSLSQCPNQVSLAG